ncbi:hypothetical protein [Actinophytocola sp.]
MKNLARAVLGLIAAAALTFAGSAVAAADDVVVQPAGNCATCV